MSPECDLLQNLLTAAKRNIRLPSLRFFTPTENFWALLAEVIPKEVQLVDCGTGIGDLIVEAASKGFSLEGIDLCQRDGQKPLVRIADACTEEWSPKRWPMFCRPSHDGWAYLAMQRARKSGATSLYVGLPSNYERDLGRIRSTNMGVVGEEGERLYLICPLKK